MELEQSMAVPHQVSESLAQKLNLSDLTMPPTNNKRVIDVTTAVVDAKTPINRRRIVSNQQKRESDAKTCNKSVGGGITKKTKVRQVPVPVKEKTHSIGKEKEALPRKAKTEGGIQVEGKQAPSMKIRSAAASKGMDEGDDDSEYDDYDDSNLLPVYNDDRLATSRDNSWAYYDGRECEGGESVSIGNDRKRKFQPPGAVAKDSAQHDSIRRISYQPNSSAVGAGIHHYRQKENLDATGKHTVASVSENLLDATAQQHGAAESAKGWTEEMHRQLVEAIYEIGVSHASPSVIMEHMTFMSTTEALDGPDAAASDYSSSNQVTSERVKSHLQKHRKNKKKSKDEFRRQYDRWMQKALTVVGGISAAARTSLVSTPAAVVEMMGETTESTKSSSSKEDPTRKLIGGDLAAFLAYSVMLEEEHARISQQERSTALNQFQSQPIVSAAETSLMMLRNGGDLPATSASQKQALLPSAMEYTHGLSGARIPLPVLTEEERQSSLGVSISHVVGLFYSMSHHLMKERRKDQQQSSNFCDTEGNNGEASGTRQQPSSAYASATSVGAPPLPGHLARPTGSGMPGSAAPPSENSNDNRRKLLHVNYNSSSYQQQTAEDRYHPVTRHPQYPPEEESPEEKANMHYERQQPQHGEGPWEARSYSGP
jgi:hypothetical protein